MTDETPLPPNLPDYGDEFVTVRPFAARDLIGCRGCKRPNPPNRVNCIYCGATLPDDELKMKLQRPSLRKLTEAEFGRSIVILGRKDFVPSPEAISGVSDLLSILPRIVASILGSQHSLPIARVSEEVEADLTLNRLKEFGIDAIAVSDDDLGLSKLPPKRIPRMEFTGNGVTAILAGGNERIEIPWSSFRLMVTGRLLESRVEVEERKRRSDEPQITNSTETSDDELVFDLFAVESPQAFRISARSFDFSCLDSEMDLISAKNFGNLFGVLRKQAPNCQIDDSFPTLRKNLDVIWPVEQRNLSTGVKRLSLGRYRTEVVLSRNNEIQFTRYSYLVNFLSTRGYK